MNDFQVTVNTNPVNVTVIKQPIDVTVSVVGVQGPSGSSDGGGGIQKVFEVYLHADYIVDPAVGIQPALTSGYNVLLTQPTSGDRGIYSVNGDNSLSLRTSLETTSYDGSIVWAYLKQSEDNGTQTGPFTYGVYFSEFCFLVPLMTPNFLPINGGNMVGPIFFGNYGQNINVGSFDNGLGGGSGISLNCAVNYELNWQAGHLKSWYNGATQPLMLDSSLIIDIGGGASLGSATKYRNNGFSHYTAGVSGNSFIVADTSDYGGSPWGNSPLVKFIISTGEVQVPVNFKNNSMSSLDVSGNNSVGPYILINAYNSAENSGDISFPNHFLQQPSFNPDLLGIAVLDEPQPTGGAYPLYINILDASGVDNTSVLNALTGVVTYFSLTQNGKTAIYQTATGSFTLAQGQAAYDPYYIGSQPVTLIQPAGVSFNTTDPIYFGVGPMEAFCIVSGSGNFFGLSVQGNPVAVTSDLLNQVSILQAQIDLLSGMLNTLSGLAILGQ
jgi:hypothetical protein